VDIDRILTQRFKLLLSRFDKSPFVSLKPMSTTPSRIYTDFLNFVFTHTVAFFKNTEENGSQTWERVFRNEGVEIVMVYPTMLSRNELGILCKAIAETCFISKDLGCRLHFVTEREALKNLLSISGVELPVR
jgi:hypothetical protein